MAAALSDVSDLTDDEDLLPTQPVDNRVLKDVVVYVEVRSTNDNRSSAISKELQQLGARVSKKFADDVTHVVFKEGSKRTKNKAQKKGIYLVSVLWVDSCKKNQEHVSERMYPASLPDEKSTPLFISKLKKCKSMQPRDFDEDVANSAERYKKRKRRIDTLGRIRSDDSTPVSSPKLGGILVLDTQPRSPFEEDILTPVRLAIPDTPPSMKEKMKSLQKKQLDELELSRTSQDGDIDSTGQQPLYRKLFENSMYSQDSSSSSEVLDLAKLCGSSGENTPKPSPLLLNNEHLSVDSATKTTKKSVGRRKSIATAKASEGVTASSGRKSTRRRSVNPVSTVNSINITEQNAVTCIGEETHSNKISSTDKSSPKNPDRKRRSPTQNTDTSQKIGKKQTTNRKKSSLPHSKDSSPKDLQTSEAQSDNERKSSESQLTRTDGAMQTKFKGRRKSVMSLKEKEIELKDSVTENSQESGQKVTKKRRKSVTFLDVADTVSKTSAKSKQKARRKTVVGICTSSQEGEGKNDLCLNQPQSPITSTSKITTSQYTSKTLDRILMETEQIEMSMKKKKLNSLDEESEQSDDNPFPKPKSGRNNSRRKLLATNDVEPCRSLIEPNVCSQKSWSAILETSHKDESKKQKDNNSTGARKGKRKMKSEKTENDESSNKQMRNSSQSVQQENIPKSKSLKKKDDGHQDSTVTSCSGTSSDDEKEDVMQKSLKDIGLSCSTFTNASMQSTGLESKLGMSMSAVFGDDSMSLSGLCRPRPSIDEFNFRKFMPKMKNKSVVRPRKALSESSVTSTCNDNNTSSEDKSNSDSDTSTSQRLKKQMKENAAGNRSSPNRSSIVMTSLHTHEQDVVISIVKKLRGFVISDNVSDTTTHVVCGGPRRTLNLLYGLSRGCWLLHQNWVLESLDAGKWLPEEKYEITDWFPTVQVTRRAKEDLKDKYKSVLFSNVGAMFVSQKTSPPRSHLISLIRMCGGQVTASSSKAQMIIGTDFYPDKMSVTPAWVLDCITQLEVLEVDKYLLGKPKRESSPEF